MCASRYYRGRFCATQLDGQLVRGISVFDEAYTLKLGFRSDRRRSDVGFSCQLWVGQIGQPQQQSKCNSGARTIKDT